jgi:hypothetical protein
MKGEILPAKAAEFEWTDERKKALELFLLGIPKVQIAEQVKVHRNTINNWTSHPSFLLEARRRHDEHVATTRQRRIRETNAFTDRLAKLTHQTLETAEAHPESKDARYAARDWLDQYRLFRAEERTDFGDNVTKHEHKVATVSLFGTLQTPEGQPQHTNAVSFKAFMEDQIKHGGILPELVDTTDVHSIITGMAQQVLIDGDLLDQINEEDMAAELEVKKP